MPKFGEWDVNNPASADGFTVIFNKARDEKKTSTMAGITVTPQKSESEPVEYNKTYPSHPPKVKYRENFASSLIYSVSAFALMSF